MSYYMSNGGAVSQAAAGMGQTTGAWRDGLFGEDWTPEGPPGTLEGAFRDGIFGPMGAVGALDLNDPNAMKEVKALLAFWQPEPTIASSWFTDPAWDAKAESKYMAYASTQPAQTIVMSGGHATPNGAGLMGLYMGYETATGKEQAAAQLPILAGFVGGGGGDVIAPKSFGAGGVTKAGMNTKTLAGIGVGIAVLGVAYLVLKKK